MILLIMYSFALSISKSLQAKKQIQDLSVTTILVRQRTWEHARQTFRRYKRQGSKESKHIYFDNIVGPSKIEYILEPFSNFSFFQKSLGTIKFTTWVRYIFQFGRSKK